MHGRWAVGVALTGSLVVVGCFDEPEVIEGTDAGTSAGTTGTATSTSAAGTSGSTTAGPTTGTMSTSDPSSTSDDPPGTGTTGTNGTGGLSPNCDVFDDFNGTPGPLEFPWRYTLYGAGRFRIEGNVVVGEYVSGDSTTFHDWIVVQDDPAQNVELSIIFEVTQASNRNEPFLVARVQNSGPYMVMNGFIEGYALVANTEENPSQGTPGGRLCIMRFTGGPGPSEVWCDDSPGFGSLSLGTYRLSFGVSGSNPTLLQGRLERAGEDGNFVELAVAVAQDVYPELEGEGFYGFGGGEGYAADGMLDPTDVFIQNYAYDDFCADPEP